MERSLRYRPVSLSGLSRVSAEREYRARFGINLRGWRIIAPIGRHAPVTNTEIAMRSPIKKTRISRPVASPIERGLVTPPPDAKDGRKIYLWLPRADADLYDAVAPTSLARDARFFGGLGEADVAALDRIVARLSEHMHGGEADLAGGRGAAPRRSPCDRSVRAFIEP